MKQIKKRIKMSFKLSLFLAILLTNYKATMLARSIETNKAKSNIEQYMKDFTKKQSFSVTDKKLKDYLRQAKLFINEESKNNKIDSKEIDFIKKEFRNFIKEEFSHTRGKRTKQIKSKRQEVGYRQARKQIRHDVKNFIRKDQRVTKISEISSRWRSIKKTINKQLRDKSYLNEAKDLVVKKSDISSIII